MDPTCRGRLTDVCLAVITALSRWELLTLSNHRTGWKCRFLPSSHQEEDSPLRNATGTVGLDIVTTYYKPAAHNKPDGRLCRRRYTRSIFTIPVAPQGIGTHHTVSLPELPDIGTMLGQTQVITNRADTVCTP